MEGEELTEEQLIDFAKQHSCGDVNHLEIGAMA
jgi:hypothetical protein